LLSRQQQQTLRETQIQIFQTLKKEQEAKRNMERNDEAYARRLQLELNAMSLTHQEASVIVSSSEQEQPLRSESIITEEENHDDEVLNFVLELSMSDETIDNFNTTTAAITWEDMMVVNNASYMDTTISTADDTLSLSREQSPTSSPTTAAASYPRCTSSSSTNGIEDHPTTTTKTHRYRSGSRSTRTRPSARRD
jgi:hypothetical protein